MNGSTLKSKVTNPRTVRTTRPTAAALSPIELAGIAIARKVLDHVLISAVIERAIDEFVRDRKFRREWRSAYRVAEMLELLTIPRRVPVDAS